MRLQKEVGVDLPAGLAGAEQAQLVGVELVQAEQLRGELDVSRGNGPVAVEEVVDVVLRAASRIGQVLHALAFFHKVPFQVRAHAVDRAGADGPPTGCHAVVGVLAASHRAPLKNRALDRLPLTDERLPASIAGPARSA